MKQLAFINPEQVTEADVKAYRLREAARAVVFDEEGNVAVLHVVNRRHYTLPGGKIEAGEDMEAALRRECREEIGVKIDILGEIGMIVEYRRVHEMKQVSYGYVARVVGKKQESQFTKKERAKGFAAKWLSYAEALEVFKHTSPTTNAARDYIVPRDLLLLKEAKNYVQKY